MIQLKMIFCVVLMALVTVSSSAAPQDRTAADKLIKQGEENYAKGAFSNALADFTAAQTASKEWPGYLEKSLQYKIAASAAGAKAQNPGLLAVRCLRQMDPNLARDEDLRKIEVALLQCDDKVNAAIAVCKDVLMKASTTSDPTALRNLCLQARIALRPFLSNPFQENIELWRLAGVLAVIQHDRGLATAVQGAFSRILKDAATREDTRDLVPQLIQLCSSGQDFYLHGSGSNYLTMEIMRQFRYPLDSRSDIQSDPRGPWAADARWNWDVSKEIDFAEKLKVAGVLIDASCVLPDIDRAGALVEAALSDMIRNTATMTKEARKEALFAISNVWDYELCLHIRQLDDATVNRNRIMYLCTSIANLREMSKPESVGNNLALCSEFTEVGRKFHSASGPICGFRPATNFEEQEFWLKQAIALKLRDVPVRTWYFLGIMYNDDSNGHKADVVRALDAYQKAATAPASTDPDVKDMPRDATFEVGLIYYYGGGGVEKNRFTAKTYLERAENLGAERAVKKLRDENFATFKKWDRW